MSVAELMDSVDVIGVYITIIPFTTTVAGLTDQLMTKSIMVKHPEMEIKRIELLQTESKLWKDRLELNDKLLFELSNSQGDILKNEVGFLRFSLYDLPFVNFEIFPETSPNAERCQGQQLIDRHISA